MTAPVYDFDTLAPAQLIAGPAIVESAMTTVLLRPGEHATVTPLGWLDIAITHNDAGPLFLICMPQRRKSAIVN